MDREDVVDPLYQFPYIRSRAVLDENSIDGLGLDRRDFPAEEHEELFKLSKELKQRGGPAWAVGQVVENFLVQIGVTQEHKELALKEKVAWYNEPR